MAKITQVISDSNIGGAGVLLSRIVGAISDSFEVEVILPTGSRLTDRLRSLGARITELPISPDKSFSPSDICELYLYLSRNRPDILHSHASLSSRIAGRLLGIRRLLSTRHCAKAEAGRSPLARALYNRFTDLTVATADFAKENLKREGVPEGKIVTIKNASPSRERLSPENRRRLRHSLSIPDGAVVIGSCARLEYIKGHDLIIRAARRLVPMHDIRLLFVGDGGEAAKIRALCASLGLLDRVIFTGFVSDPNPYQSIFDINVNASRGTETSCLATSECMSLGIASVVSDFGGNTEMIEDGVSGLVFQSDDELSLALSLDMLISDRALYQRLCRGAREAFERSFSLPRMSKSYLELYRALI